MPSPNETMPKPLPKESLTDGLRKDFFIDKGREVQATT